MWRISVFSVVIDADGRWVQIELSGPSRWSLLLRLNAQADVRDVLSAIESRLSQPYADDGSILFVTGAGDHVNALSTEQGVSAHVMCTPAS
jgi:hypothetical protein